MKSRLLVFLLLAAAVAARAGVKSAALFADHAVLQRDKPVPTWGAAEVWTDAVAQVAPDMEIL